MNQPHFLRERGLTSVLEYRKVAEIRNFAPPDTYHKNALTILWNAEIFRVENSPVIGISEGFKRIAPAFEIVFVLLEGQRLDILHK